MEEWANRLAGRLLERFLRKHAHPSSGVRRGPQTTRSKQNPKAHSGRVVAWSYVATRRWRAAASGTLLKIGSSGSNGSPGKYICVTSRCRKLTPKMEK